MPAPPPKTAGSAHKKDYSALRIGGRQELKLPGIGLIHADKREDSSGGEVLFSGRVFIEMSLPASGGKPLFLYAYAERALWNSETSVLCLEGLAIVEGPRSVIQSTDADTRMFFDKTGKLTTKGGHEMLTY